MFENTMEENEYLRKRKRGADRVAKKMKRLGIEMKGQI